MQRWHLSLTLGGVALLVAVLAPDLLATPTVEVSPPKRGPVAAPTPDTDGTGDLTARAALDQSVQLRGEDEDRFLVIELSADELAAAARSPIHAAVVVDTSSSMGGDGKIEYARQALHALTAQLGPDDSFSLVQFDSTASVVVPQTPATDTALFAREISSLHPAGGTAIAPGLRLGAAQLAEAPSSGTRRIVLLSDGMSGDSAASLAALASGWSEAGVTTTALGLGLDFDDRLLTAVADAGGGRYHYVDDPTALTRLFAEELDSMARIAARGVQVEVRLDGAEPVAVYGYEDYDGRRTADGYTAFIGDMTSGQTRKVVARLDLDPGTDLSEIADITVRFTDPGTEQVRTIPLSVSTTWTDDPDAVLASLDPRAGRHAARALAGVALSDGMELWRSGNSERALEVLSDGERLLSDMIARYRITDLDGALENLRRQAISLDAVEATSQAGRTAFLGEQLRALGYIE